MCTITLNIFGKSFDIFNIAYEANERKFKQELPEVNINDIAKEYYSQIIKLGYAHYVQFDSKKFNSFYKTKLPEICFIYMENQFDEVHYNINYNQFTEVFHFLYSAIENKFTHPLNYEVQLMLDNFTETFDFNEFTKYIKVTEFTIGMDLSVGIKKRYIGNKSFNKLLEGTEKGAIPIKEVINNKGKSINELLEEILVELRSFK